MVACGKKEMGQGGRGPLLQVCVNDLRKTGIVTKLETLISGEVSLTFEGYV